MKQRLEALKHHAPQAATGGRFAKIWHHCDRPKIIDSPEIYTKRSQRYSDFPPVARIWH